MKRTGLARRIAERRCSRRGLRPRGRVGQAVPHAVGRQPPAPQRCAALRDELRAVAGELRHREGDRPRLAQARDLGARRQIEHRDGAVPLDALDVEEWDAQLAIELRAAWLCARAAIPHMRRQGGGRIINFADWVAESGRPRYTGYVAYYVAKAGVVSLTEALALELAADQILVNAIAPGPIVSPEGTSKEEHDAVIRATPLGRWGGEIEIAKAVAALVDSDFITGETIRVDGGRHLK